MRFVPFPCPCPVRVQSTLTAHCFCDSWKARDRRYSGHISRLNPTFQLTVLVTVCWVTVTDELEEPPPTLIPPALPPPRLSPPALPPPRLAPPLLMLMLAPPAPPESPPPSPPASPPPSPPPMPPPSPSPPPSPPASPAPPAINWTAAEPPPITSANLVSSPARSLL